MKIPRIVSFSGFKGVGKNTFANDLIARYGYKEAAFADPLKNKVAEWILSSLNIPEDVPEYIRDLAYLCREELYAFMNSSDRLRLKTAYELAREFVRTKPYSDNLRKLIQFVGTEYYRAKDEAYWIKSMHLDPDQHYVITDRRFHNETDLSRLYGAACWKIWRYNFGGDDQHPSEAQINNLFNHYAIHNAIGEQEKIPHLNDSYLALSVKLDDVITMEIE